MKAEQIVREIDQLSLSERLILVEDIWDSIVLGNAELPIPQWQKDELNSRYGEYRSGELSLHDWQEVHAALRG